MAKRRSNINQPSSARSQRQPNRITAPQPRGHHRPNPRIHGRIADDLGIAILSGHHAAGSILPTEVEAAEKLGVSRTAYREAIRFLAAKGLVDSKPKVGTRVTERNDWHVLDPDVLRWVFQTEPSEQFIQELFELRAILEPQAAALAASRRTVEQLSRMGHALEEMARHGLNTETGRAADQAFHEEILKATGNTTLMALTTTIGAAVHWTTVFKQRSLNLARDPMPEHRNVYAAIASGDPDLAKQAAKELLQLALQDTRASLKGDGRGSQGPDAARKKRRKS
ncbi:MAG TPA: FadR/GntR family transcriptional regulator [Steroidobacteraceae bacterium]|nr:FadR/GntR family transcriptional regulator [Steroidobacteraceae bacterium]